MIKLFFVGLMQGTGFTHLAEILHCKETAVILAKKTNLNIYEKVEGIYYLIKISHNKNNPIKLHISDGRLKENKS